MARQKKLIIDYEALERIRSLSKKEKDRLRAKAKYYDMKTYKDFAIDTKTGKMQRKMVMHKYLQQQYKKAKLKAYSDIDKTNATVAEKKLAKKLIRAKLEIKKWSRIIEIDNQAKKVKDLNFKNKQIAKLTGKKYKRLSVDFILKNPTRNGNLNYTDKELSLIRKNYPEMVKDLSASKV